MKSIFGRFIFSSALLIAIAAVLISACGTAMKPMQTSENAEAVDQITELERRFAEAALRGDYARIEGLLAPEFVGVDPGGRELSKSQVLAGLQSPERVIEVLRHDNIRVRIYGDCAVVFAVTVMKGKYQGKDFEGEFPYMRVWIKRQGQWLAVATQSSGALH